MFIKSRVPSVLLHRKVELKLYVGYFGLISHNKAKVWREAGTCIGCDILMHGGLFFLGPDNLLLAAEPCSSRVDPITFRWDLIRLILSEMSELTSLTCLFLAGLWPHALSRPLTAYLT